MYAWLAVTIIVFCISGVLFKLIEALKAKNLKAQEEKVKLEKEKHEEEVKQNNRRHELALIKESKKCKHQWKYDRTVRICTECGIKECEHKYELNEDKYVCVDCGDIKCNHDWKERERITTVSILNDDILGYKYVYTCMRCGTTKVEIAKLNV